MSALLSLELLKSLAPVLGPVLGAVLIYFFAYRQGKRTEQLKQHEAAEARDDKLFGVQKELQQLEDKRHETIENARNSTIDELIRLFNQKFGSSGKGSGSSSDSKTK